MNSLHLKLWYQSYIGCCDIYSSFIKIIMKLFKSFGFFLIFIWF